MQEHIRRAHPEHYIAKLPATEESFALMVNTPPSERPAQPSQASSSHAPVAPPSHHLDGAGFYNEPYDYPPPGRSSDELRRPSLIPATDAAGVLAQLHNQRPEIHWDNEPPDLYSDNETGFNNVNRPRVNFGPSVLEHNFGDDYYPDFGASRRDLMPSSLVRSPPYHRSSTLPPAPRPGKLNRPRKSSITENARRPKHERTKSKGHARRMSHDRKAMSAEPTSALAKIGNRWEDLIEAAASATEEDSRDLTPVRHCYDPFLVNYTDEGMQMPPSPKLSNRNSLPPLLAAHHHFNSANNYTASPLQHALTPPPPDLSDLHPFPSVESSIDSNISKTSGQNFHINSTGLSDSSPSFQHPIQIYCAGCRRLSVLKESYACTECVCGLCKDCVDALWSEQSRGRAVGCPKCEAVGGKFKVFMLDIR
ncbi:hypothetical protein Vi05172_g11524 [Venturia inaequalis]|uniref:RING zinc finger-like domain-containing protein n=1 Tax=Venturia inaequalis TaxID=5025 RepID=A0A8H3VTH2_VENIN|nr:hypothetical protein EG327_008568 [Venturia inaequalis]RDI78493.1 hypothetical protein Vi05172_g11524 [Venturia inaequalis]